MLDEKKLKGLPFCTFEIRVTQRERILDGFLKEEGRVYALAIVKVYPISCLARVFTYFF